MACADVVSLFSFCHYFFRFLFFIFLAPIKEVAKADVGGHSDGTMCKP